MTKSAPSVELHVDGTELERLLQGSSLLKEIRYGEDDYVVTVTARRVTNMAILLQRPEIVQAMKDWKSGKAYLDNNGNYRLKRDGAGRGPISPWNKEVKRTFRTSVEFHQAAQKAFPQGVS